MTSLTEAQSALLTQAADAPDGGVEAVPNDKTSRPLIKSGLFIALPQAGGANRLLVTTAGLAAIGREPETAPTGSDEDIPATAAPVAPLTTKPSLPKGKIGLLITLLQRCEGVSVETMMEATGWQAHSVRGALAGTLKRKLGYAVMSEKSEQGRRYRIVTPQDIALDAAPEAAQ